MLSIYLGTNHAKYKDDYRVLTRPWIEEYVLHKAMINLRLKDTLGISREDFIVFPLNHVLLMTN